MGVNRHTSWLPQQQTEILSSDMWHAQFELDGQGALHVAGDSAVVTVFEFKSSMAGEILSAHSSPRPKLMPNSSAVIAGG